MSLKSKLEAVIYASEEPVSLSQLALLFAAEALDYRSAQQAEAAEKAEREAAANAQAAAGAVDPSQPLVAPQIAEGLEYLQLRTEDGTLLDQPGFAVLPEAEASEASEGGADSESAEQQPATEASGREADDSAPAEESATDAGEQAPVDPEAEAKRAARQRDREVKAVLRELIDELIREYSSDDRGIEIREIAGGYRMATKPECHDAVRMFIKSLKPAMKLSLPALETLAVIAYKQPVTAPEVNEIRGVDSSGVFGSLLARKLITTAGRKQVIGRPILYKTTKEFLLRFGLKDVAELPSMDEFEKMASELEEVEPSTTADDSDTAASYESGAAGGPELDEDASEEAGQDAPQLSTTAEKSESSQTAVPAVESNQQQEPVE